LRPAAAAAAVIAGGVLGFATPAFAHAQLLGTSPTSGAVLATPPAQVVLTFGEAVQAPPTAIEVFSADGQQLHTGPAGHPPGRPDQVAASLPGSLKGTYVVSWRVISADTHPVQGAFTFSVGAASEGSTVGALEERLLAARHPSQGLGALTGALRTLILLAVLVTLGAVGLLLRWPSGLERTEVPILLLSGTLLAATASVAAVLAQGPYDAGKPLGHAFRSNVLSPVLHSNFGTGAAVRIGSSLLILSGVLVGMAARRQARQTAAHTPTTIGPQKPIPPLWLLVSAAGCVGLVVSLSLSGHATTGRWEPFGFIADLVHIGGAAIWVGGLIVLAAVLSRRGTGQDAGELGTVVRRFSATAVWAVGLIVASGVFQAWRQLGSWKALTDTDYGTLLLLKVTLVIATIEAGWFSRRWVGKRLMGPAVVGATATSEDRSSAEAVGVSATLGSRDRTEAVGATSAIPRWRDGPGAATAPGPLEPTDAGGLDGDARSPTAPRFRRWLAFEAALGIGIVALTGALIDAAPPQGETVASAARAFTARAPVGSDVLSVSVYPLVPGPVHVAIQLTDRATEPVNAFQVTAQVSLPSRNIGPINVPLTHQFTGSWVADNVLLPVAGHWKLQVNVLTDPITEIDRSFRFTIYG
jgi:copper transport protein